MAGSRRAAGFGWGRRLWQPVSSRYQPCGADRSRCTAHLLCRGVFAAWPGDSYGPELCRRRLRRAPGWRGADGVFQSYTNPGVVTILDFSGDSIMALANVGNGPLGFTVDSTGSTAYSENCDGTISAVPISICAADEQGRAAVRCCRARYRSIHWWRAPANMWLSRDGTLSR